MGEMAHEHGMVERGEASVRPPLEEQGKFVGFL